jgi:mannose-1-phosphate guanylyltransferase
MIIPIILAGGSGTRLWPLSRKIHPKQFISLVNETSLFQDTLTRLPKEALDPIVICNEDHRFLVAEQAREINVTLNSIILEPIGRNTAPAIALAAIKVLNDFENPILIVLAADHKIENKSAFHDAIKIAHKLAENNKLVTFGIIPKSAETGYGYIEIEKKDKAEYFDIKSFVEKPNQKNAINFLNSGNYLWTSGMFMFNASIYLSELNKFEPEILTSCKKSLSNEFKDLEFIRIDKKEFCKSPNQSIDYAVMEKTNKAKVVPLDAGWSDVGSWDALMDSKIKDSLGNVVEGDVTLDQVKNSYLYSTNRLVAASNIADLIVIDTQDALLVTTRDNSLSIKNIVKKLKKNKRTEIENHRKVYKPWGYYDSIDTGYNFQVKRILVNPGAKLSLQKHLHRAEHWVVVSGVAKITCGKKIYNLEKNQSTYIPKGEIHRLENIESYPLEIIEVQTGNYLGEDDIIRLKDDYQRN